MQVTVKYTDAVTKDFAVAYHEGDKDEHKAIMFHDWVADEPKVSFTKVYGDEIIIFTDKPCQILDKNGYIHIVNKEVN
jgi:phenolic acid decarboxylase